MKLTFSQKEIAKRWISGLGISSHGAKLILQSVLLAIFVCFFGLPAIEKYEKKEVMKVATSKETQGIPR